MRHSTKPDEFLWLYSMGKRFRVRAICTTEDEANEYMEKHSDTSLIACFGPFNVIADTYSGLRPTPADRGTARAIIAHMEQPIPCRYCGKPLHIHSLGWKHSENGYLTCNVSGMVQIAEPKPDAPMGEDYITGESMPLSLVTREQGGHVRTLTLNPADVAALEDTVEAAQ